MHTRAITAVNRWVSRNVTNESATQDDEGERVGWLDRIFGYVYHVRLLGKRMKAWNKRVYCGVKYLLLRASSPRSWRPRSLEVPSLPAFEVIE